MSEGPSWPDDPRLDADRGSRILGWRNHAALISTTSTILFFVAAGLVIALAPGSHEVFISFFSPQNMRDALFGVPSEGLPSVLAAFFLNIRVFLVAEVLILALGLLIAIVRQIPGPAFFPFRLVATVYTDLFRGVPLLLVILIMGFGIPALRLQAMPSSVVVLGTIALVLSYSAYVAEVYRAGIESIHPSQVASARALGLSRWQALRYVVVPQAVRRVIPPLLNDFISLQKDTALLSTLGVIEAVRAAQIYASSRFNYSSYTVAAILFVLLTIPMARFTDRLIERDRRRRAAGGAQ